MAFKNKGDVSQAAVMNIASDAGLDSGAFVDCMKSHSGLKVVTQDMKDAINAGIRSTPTLVINGRILKGVPKPWMLSEILRYAGKHLPLEEPAGRSGF